MVPDDRRPLDRLALIVYPFDLNPYQRRLYEAIQTVGTDCTLVYVRRRTHLGPLPFFTKVGLARARGYRLIHVHWPRFALRSGNRTYYRLSLLNAVASIWWLRILGIRMVWTVHNTLPHEAETADDALVTRLLAGYAVRKIVHSEATVRELEAVGADPRRVTVIPHGSYVGTYHEKSQAEGRRALDLPEKARIVLFFGQIRPYKGVDDLTDAWSRVVGERRDGAQGPFLLLAGKCDDTSQRQGLAQAVATVGGRFDDGYVDEDRVSLYFAAADVVVLPFRAVTTSGSALLAMSLSRPVVAPQMGTLGDLPQGAGFFYDDGELEPALRRAIDASTSELEARARAARSYADGLSWSQIARSTLEVYREASR